MRRTLMFLLLILCAACQTNPTLVPVPSPPPLPTETVSPTHPPTPTASLTPAPSLTPTRTPFPTRTPTPTSTPTLTPNPINLAGLEVISVENVERMVPLRGFYDHASYFVDDLEFSPDGTMLASTAFTEGVWVWDTATGAEIFRFVDRDSGAEGVSFSPDGKLLATRTGAYLVNIWDTTTWQSLRTLDAETVYSGSIAFSPDGKYLATTGAGGSIDLWSTETWEIALNLPGNESDFGGTFVFSDDGKTLVSDDADFMIHVWNVETGQERQTLSGYLLGLSPDGKMIAASLPQDSLTLWNAQTGKELRTFPDHSLLVRDVVFLSDGEYLFSGNDDRTISFWDARNGDEPRVISGFSDAVSRIALSEDGKLLAAASDDGWITILGIPSGSDAQTPYNFPATPTPTATLDLVAQLQGQCLAGRAGLTETDALGGRIVLDSAVTLPNGRSNRDSFFLDVATCAASRINQGNEGGFYYAVSPDRTLLAYKNSVFDALDNVLGEELVIKNFKGEKLLSLPWETEWLRLVDWLDNERIIINPYKQQENLAKTYSTLTVLNPFTGERQILNPDFAKMYEYTPFPDWDGWGVTMYDPKLTRVVYFSESSETSVVLWDLKEGKRLATLLSSGYSAPQWSPDGSHFTMESFNLDQRAWELYMVTWDGQVEQLTNLYGDDQTRLSNYSWSPDGQFIAAWISNEITRENNESQLVILDIATRAVKYFDVWIKHGGDTYSGPPQKPIWSPNGKYLVVLDWYMQEHRHVFLVDVANGIFIPLAEDMEPVGWMLAP